MTAMCAVEGCVGLVKARGWCRSHYARWQRHGDPSKGNGVGQYLRPAVDVRFWLKVDKAAGEQGCWLWKGYITANGYGRVSRGHHVVDYAHRVSYELTKGSIPDGFHIDHLCRNTRCVNPSHLEAVEPRVNYLRGTGASAQNAAKAHCPAGHPYDLLNTLVTTTGRQCRECHRIRDRAKHQAQKAVLG